MPAFLLDRPAPLRSINCCLLSAPPRRVIQESLIISVPFPNLRFLARWPWLSILLVTLAACLLWLDIFAMPLSPVIPDLDPSWSGALIHFSAQGLQFGKDVVFTYGPLGHLISFVYTGELFSVRLIWEFVSKTLFVLVLCFTTVRLAAFWRPFFFLFVLLFIWADPISDALYFLVICCLAAFLLKQGHSSRALNILAGILFAIFSLVKFTYFLLVVPALVLILACHCQQRRFTRAILLGLVFLGAFAVCWGLAGQQYGNLLSYLTTSMDISFGYKEAMGLPAASTTIALAGGLAALLALMQCALLFLHSRQLPVLFAALFFVGETLLSWNRAFTRADGHVLSFFSLCPVALLTMWIVVRPGATIRHIAYTINLLVFAICLFGLFLHAPVAVTNCVAHTTARIHQAWNVVTNLPARAKQLHGQLTVAKAAYALPRVQTEVGRQTVDVFGSEQGIALLNDLNYMPRPVFQGYTAYTPALIKANTEFYSSIQAPAYVLFKYQTIDDRYPGLDDAGVLKQLLFNYKPLFDEKGYSLWKRIQPAKPIQAPFTTTKSVAFDSECVTPAGEILWLQLDLKKSLHGQALGLFYKPPIVRIRVTDSSGRRLSHRLIPSMASSGFLINPHLKTARQVLRLAGGEQNPSVVSFSVQVPEEERRFFQPEIVCRFAVLPEIPRSEMDAEARRMADATVVEALPDELAQAFDDSREVLLELNPANRFEGITVPNEESTIEADGLRLKARGTDPQILLPRFPTGSQGGVLVRIDLEVPTDTGFQIFYMPAGVSAYGDHFINRFVRRGENTIYFALTDSALGSGRLRVDPGMSAGVYFITRVEVRAVPPESLSN